MEEQDFKLEGTWLTVHFESAEQKAAFNAFLNSKQYRDFFNEWKVPIVKDTFFKIALNAFLYGWQKNTNNG